MLIFSFLFKTHETTQNKSVLRIGPFESTFSLSSLTELTRKIEIFFSHNSFLPTPFGWEVSVICKLLSSGWGFTACEKFIDKLLTPINTSCVYDDLILNNSPISKQRKNIFILYAVKDIGNFSDLVKKYESQLLLLVESLHLKDDDPVKFYLSSNISYESKRCYHCHHLIPDLSFTSIDDLSDGDDEFILSSSGVISTIAGKTNNLLSYFQKVICFWCESAAPLRQRSLGSISPI